MHNLQIHLAFVGVQLSIHLKIAYYWQLSIFDAVTKALHFVYSFTLPLMTLLENLCKFPYAQKKKYNWWCAQHQIDQIQVFRYMYITWLKTRLILQNWILLQCYVQKNDSLRVSFSYLGNVCVCLFPMIDDIMRAGRWAGILIFLAKQINQNSALLALDSPLYFLVFVCAFGAQMKLE